MLTGALVFISATSAIIWSLLFLPLGYLNIRLHKLSGQRVKAFLKKVKTASIWTNNDPDGWICGKWYIGYIYSITGGMQSGGDTKDLYLFCTDKFYKEHIELKETNDVEKTKPTKKINYYEREGSFWRLTYTPRQINLPKKPARPTQKTAIKAIMHAYKDAGYAVCLLHGKAGTGKSMAAQYLCAELLNTARDVGFVDSFNPFEHGDNFTSLYTQVNPTADTPLVIMLEEIDGNIMLIHNGKVVQTEHIPVQIKNKADWNGFLDKFDRELYPHVILLLTTNKPACFFDELDPSYMRPGRVNLKFEF